MKINKKKSIYKCYLNGGLGNQIFQYILLMWIKDNTNKEILIIKSDYTGFKNLYRRIRNVQPLFFYKWLISDQKITSEIYIIKRLQARINNHIKPIFKGFLTNKSFLYYLDKDKKEFLSYIKNSNFLKSSCIYPQILNYEEFKPYWKKIGEICARSIDKNNFHNKEKHDLVIHIRKGDYIKGGKNLFSLVTANYYNNSIQYFIEKFSINRKLKCLVIGNDLQWAQKILRKDIDFIYQFQSEIIDFYTIATSKNIITANSSFSFSAAMVSMTTLDETCIVCPKNYYQGANSFGSLKNKNWISIEN